MATDILQVQEVLFAGAKSCALFDAFNMTQERQFLMESEIEFSAIWQSPRLILSDASDPSSALMADPNGKVGAGYYFEMPRLEIKHPNGLQRNLIVSVASIEERNLNFAPGGTMTSTEEMAELMLDFMFGWCMGLSSALTPETGAVLPAYDLVGGKDSGLMSYRATVSLRRERRFRARCDVPVLAEPNAGTFTLTNGSNTPDADIYYMTAGDVGDLRLPGKSNSDAVKYSGPVSLDSGTVVNWAAWRADKLPSHISVAQVT